MKTTINNEMKKGLEIWEDICDGIEIEYNPKFADNNGDIELDRGYNNARYTKFVFNINTKTLTDLSSNC